MLRSDPRFRPSGFRFLPANVLSPPSNSTFLLGAGQKMGGFFDFPPSQLCGQLNVGSPNSLLTPFFLLLSPKSSGVALPHDPENARLYSVASGGLGPGAQQGSLFQTFFGPRDCLSPFPSLFFPNFHLIFQFRPLPFPLGMSGLSSAEHWA